MIRVRFTRSAKTPPMSKHAIAETSRADRTIPRLTSDLVTASTANVSATGAILSPK